MDPSGSSPLVGRDELRAFLSERGIGNGLYYPLGLHLQEFYGG